jgi:hypothetical protein
MAEVTEEFAKCWQAAGLHIQNQAQDGLQSWLRSHLNPPFLEHLSFRMGNQLFFIQIEDVDNLMFTPGSLQGLMSIANGCNGHACLMPMKLRNGEWTPALGGWGLIDAISKQEINPVALVSDELIEVTDWELQDFAVQIVRDNLRENGRELMSWQGNPSVDPSIWFVGDSGPEWVIVRAARYPKKRSELPSNIHKLIDGMGVNGNFASVGIANSDDPFDPMAEESNNFLPIYRGHPTLIAYKGLEKIRDLIGTSKN